MSTIPVYVIEDKSAIVQRMINYFRTAQTKITDFNEGAEVRNLLEAVGITDYELRYLIDYLFRMGYPQTAEGDWLDMIGLLVNCIRKPAVQATGSLTISTPHIKTSPIVISDGTLFICSTDPTLFFQSVGAVTLAIGATTLNVDGIATVGGANGNVIPGIIDKFYAPISDLTVNNPLAFINGADVEDDTSFRSRILQAGQGSITGSVAWYKSETLKIEGVHDVQVINNPPIPGVDIELIVNGEIKPTPDSVITEIVSLFGQDDHAIPGVNVLVVKPNYLVQNVDVTVTLKPGYNWTTIEETLAADITAYFQGGTASYGVDYPGLNENDGLVRAMLELVIANSLSSFFLNFNLSTPAEDVIINNSQAIELGNINLTQTS